MPLPMFTLLHDGSDLTRARQWFSRECRETTLLLDASRDVADVRRVPVVLRGRRRHRRRVGDYKLLEHEERFSFIERK